MAVPAIEQILVYIADSSLKDALIYLAAYNIVDYSKKINKLKKARNEIGHNPHIRNRHIDPKLLNGILEPCFEIINKLFDQLIEPSKKKEK